MSATALGVNSQAEPQSKEQGWAELSVLQCNLISLKILYHLRHLTILQWRIGLNALCLQAFPSSAAEAASAQVLNPFFLRPCSDVVLLPCRTKLQFGSTLARLEINSNSDVVPESNQIQGLLKPRENSLHNSPRETISPKYINIIYEFSWRDRSTTFEALSCQSRVAWQSLSNLIACRALFRSLIQTPCSCRAFLERNS